MHPDLTPIHGIDELDRALVESRQRPLLLFKHSYSCGVSAEALDELLVHLAEKRGEARYAMVTVQTHREVSNAIATKLGVRHETPQALLVRDGRVVWSRVAFPRQRGGAGESARASACAATHADDHAH